MRALGHPGEWWRPCFWWREAHVDGEENGWSILLHRCGQCDVGESIMADAFSKIADDRAEWERAHPEDEKARVCGMCTYCGETIRASSSGRKSFEVRQVPFDDLMYCRGAWWIKNPYRLFTWRRCYWWNGDDTASLAHDDGWPMVEVKQCLRCGEEEKVLEDARREVVSVLFA